MYKIDFFVCMVWLFGQLGESSYVHVSAAVDKRFNNLYRSHLVSQVKSVCQPAVDGVICLVS